MRHAVIVGLTAIAGIMLSASSAAASGLPSTGFGFELSAPSVSSGPLSAASADGVGVARYGIFYNANADSVVTFLAKSGIRLDPILGVPCAAGSSCTPTAPSASPPVALAEVEIAQTVQAFAARYGPGGSFWKANPTLPYLPVETYEIGNEPNLPLYWVVDRTFLHWIDPSNQNLADAADYAAVYEAARTALHQVDPTGVALVGGLADSASGGVDVPSDERMLSALTPGAVDAVGYHSWVYKEGDELLQSDTAALRVWMNGNGFGGVPLQVNEFGACDAITLGTCQSFPAGTPPTSHDVSQTSAQWAKVATSFVQWAMCSPWVGVETVQPFWWGGTSTTDSGIWLSLVDGSGSPTPYGQAYLALVKTLTTQGCSSQGGSAPSNTAAPSVSGTPVVGAQLKASPGTWTGSPAPSFGDQWEDCDGAGQSCSAIAGATSTSYTPQSADVGSTLVFTVTASNSAGGATAACAPTAVVASSAPVVPAAPPATNTAAAKKRLSSMSLRLVDVKRRGHTLTFTVRHHARSGQLLVTLSTPGRKAVHKKLKGHRRNATTMTFTVKLARGRWTLTIAGKPAGGYAKPKMIKRTFALSR